jgi:8-oxo-dGTP diphosphatase
MRYLDKFNETKVYVSKTFVTVDAVVIKESTDEILLIKRKNEPFKDHWALPGGFLDENEDLEVAARRELMEETQVEVISMKQIGAFGKPNRDPRSHNISVAYFATVGEEANPIASDDAKEVKWFAISELPQLAFDHGDIIKEGLERYY